MSHPNHSHLESDELQQIREALATTEQRTSLRSLAREVGMSPTGLRGVIDGAEPYAKTWDKLRLWYSLRQDDSGVDMPFQAVAALLRRLLRPVPQQSKHGAVVRVLNGFDEAFRFAGIIAPPWFVEVRKELLS
ncbi:MAG TPA: hypothetical protein VF746_25210 [Longimicrobium sp.]|jgi:hypothetical protein